MATKNARAGIMRSPQEKAHRYFKRTLYFTSGIGVILTTVSLAIALPIYYTLDRRLKTIPKAVDLSSFGPELVTKLVPTDTNQMYDQLRHDYQLLYDYDRTLFYHDGLHKLLVMNMNQDGSVGSAATFTNGASVWIVNKIKELQTNFAHDPTMRTQILAPLQTFVANRSLQQESLILETTPAVLTVRNLLSDPELSRGQMALDQYQQSRRQHGQSPLTLAQITWAQQLQLSNAHQWQNATQVQQQMAQAAQRVVAHQSSLQTFYQDTIANFVTNDLTTMTLESIGQLVPSHYWLLGPFVVNQPHLRLPLLQSASFKTLQLLMQARHDFDTIAKIQIKINQLHSQLFLAQDQQQITAQLRHNWSSLIGALVTSFNAPTDSDATSLTTDHILEIAKANGFSITALQKLITYLQKLGQFDHQTQQLGRHIFVQEAINASNYYDVKMRGLVVVDLEVFGTSGNQTTFMRKHLLLKKTTPTEATIFIPDVDLPADSSWGEKKIATLLALYQTMARTGVDAQVLAQKRHAILLRLEQIRATQTFDPRFEQVLSLVDYYIWHYPAITMQSTLWYAQLDGLMQHLFFKHDRPSVAQLKARFPHYFIKQITIKPTSAHKRPGQDQVNSTDLDLPSLPQDTTVKLTWLPTKTSWQNATIKIGWKTPISNDFQITYDVPVVGFDWL